MGLKNQFDKIKSKIDEIHPKPSTLPDDLFSPCTAHDSNFTIGPPINYSSRLTFYDQEQQQWLDIGANLQEKPLAVFNGFQFKTAGEKLKAIWNFDFFYKKIPIFKAIVACLILFNFISMCLLYLLLV